MYLLASTLVDKSIYILSWLFQIFADQSLWYHDLSPIGGSQESDGIVQ